MKKTFKLTHHKIKYPRLIEAVKRDVKKYLKRERNKELPEDIDFWDFDCKYGVTEETAEVIHVAELNKFIDQAESQELKSFYLEILAKPGHRTKKEKPKSTTKPAEPDPAQEKAKSAEAKPEPVKEEKTPTPPPPSSPWDRAIKRSSN